MSHRPVPSPHRETPPSGLPSSGLPSSPGRRVFLWLAATSTVLVVISGALYVLVVLTGEGDSAWSWLWGLFDVGRELNVPTWFGSMLWFLLALAAAAVGMHAPRLRASWFTLAGIATLASVDEYATLHEQLYRVGSILTPFLPFDPFSYRWVVAGVAVALIAAILLVPLALRLPLPILLGLVAAGVIFLSGAVVIETVGGFVEQRFEGQMTWHLKLLMHVEEWFEMIGVSLAIWSVLEMIRWTPTEAGVSTEFRGYSR